MNTNSGRKKEVQEIRDRYKRRRDAHADDRYGMLRASSYMWAQEKERALIRWIDYAGLAPLAEKRLLEIGCGNGNNLIQLLRLGFRAENIEGNELLEDRVNIAKQKLPEALNVIAGDAMEVIREDSSFDVVLQSTVFSSILDDEFQEKLAQKMWCAAKPGGGILWYDFVYDNPRNSDVRGVSVKRIRELFPHGEIKVWRVTLAPPICRVVTRINPALYNIFNSMPFLRSHVLCWIRKPLRCQNE